MAMLIGQMLSISKGNLSSGEGEQLIATYCFASDKESLKRLFSLFLLASGRQTAAHHNLTLVSAPS